MRARKAASRPEPLRAGPLPARHGAHAAHFAGRALAAKQLSHRLPRHLRFRERSPVRGVSRTRHVDPLVRTGVQHAPKPPRLAIVRVWWPVVRRRQRPPVGIAVLPNRFDFDHPVAAGRACAPLHRERRSLLKRTPDLKHVTARDHARPLFGMLAACCSFRPWISACVRFVTTTATTRVPPGSKATRE